MNPPSPLPQHVMGDQGYTINFGGSPSAAPATGFYNSTDGYRFIQTTATDNDNLIWFDVSTNQNITLTTGQHIVVTLSTSSTAGSEIPLIGAGTVSSNVAPPDCGINGTPSCQGTRNTLSNLSATYQKDSVLRVSFSVSALCAAASTGAGTLCGTAPNYQDMTTGVTGGVTLTQPIIVTFSAVSDNNVTGAVSGNNTDSATFTLGITNIAPTISCPTTTFPEGYYFPGDSEVYITPGNYSTGVGTGSNGATSYTGVDIKYLTFLGSQGSVNPFSTDSVPSNEIVAYLESAGGTQAVTGFTNSTNGSDHGYDVSIYAQNNVGIVSATGCAVSPNKMYAQKISGVLSESKCFIATAAYHDGRAAPVMMLRRFRDRILAKTAMGRKFIETYYRYSPALAEWAWDKPFIRSLALRALAPVEFIAWTALKVASAEETESPQPYIDRIKKQMAADEASKPADGSYTEELKKKLGGESAPDAGSGYSEKIRAGLDPVEGAEGYTEKLKAKFPEEKVKESPIEMVKAGKDRLPIPERPVIKQAVGFTLGVSPGISVSNPSGGVPYSSIYGSNWQPEVMLHYERQIFHSEYFGSFGLGLDSGLTAASGYGKLSFAFQGSTVSQTKFTFLQFPILIGAYYRFNLLRILRPYLGASLGSIFYAETRKDSVADKRGYAFAYATHAGVSLLMDFLDPSTALDGYLSMGIQHSYLFAEFLYLDTFSQTGVSFKRAGIYSGFLFEI